jgi:hypothetical protein
MALSETLPVCTSSNEYMPRKRARRLVLDNQGDNAKRKRVLDWLNSNLATPQQKRARTESQSSVEGHDSKRQRLTSIPGEAYLEDEAAMDEQTSFTTDSISTINAYSAKFDVELERRGIQFVDDEDEKCPADLEQFKPAISASRESPEPDDQEAKIVRKRILKSINEAATLQCLLPKFLPIFDIYDGDDLYIVPNQQWDKQNSL